MKSRVLVGRCQAPHTASDTSSTVERSWNRNRDSRIRVTGSAPRCLPSPIGAQCSASIQARRQPNPKVPEQYCKTGVSDMFNSRQRRKNSMFTTIILAGSSVLSACGNNIATVEKTGADPAALLAADGAQPGDGDGGPECELDTTGTLS